MYRLFLVIQSRNTEDAIVDRAASAGAPVTRELAVTLAEYLALLARWNRKINLTALPVDPPTDAAIDRLIVEPVIAARLVRHDDRHCLDVGSGGGSPALPMALARPDVEMVLVESRSRKAAFLREAIRHLRLPHASVETCRLEDLADRPERHGWADVVTLRAVRPSSAVIAAVTHLLRRQGRWFVFGELPATGLGTLAVIGRADLPTSGALVILQSN